MTPISEFRSIRLRGIDLYGGIGGWALGLELAGIDIIRSYEWWESANITVRQNLHSETVGGDIREMELSDFPKGVDVVVGSPPCTQFSFANRGGSGDIEQGLKDIYKFFEIIEYIKPSFWAMENVPRVAAILEKLMVPGESLYRFQHLFKPEKTIAVIDMSAFGLPQRRKRMIASNFPLNLLMAYTKRCRKKTLGDVLESLSEPKPSDPCFRLSISRNELTEIEPEEPLSQEELRLNREAKQYHPVYNIMQFPDPLNRPSRTVTATCTRVSRESIIIEDTEKKGVFRRLSVRERACLQGFPISFQFFGKTYTEKLKMIGNALPPVFAYYVGHAFRKTPPEKITPLDEQVIHLPKDMGTPPKTEPHTAGKTYPLKRSFRLAIPNLRFGSGVRFDFFSRFDGDKIRWEVSFFYGTSKSIARVFLNQGLREKTDLVLKKIKKYRSSYRIARMIDVILNQTSPESTQRAWIQQGDGIHPFQILDTLGNATERLLNVLDAKDNDLIKELVIKELKKENGRSWVASPSGKKKINNNLHAIFSGFFLGSYFNEKFRQS
jgi:DNA (cytosine-5)-methyltransferase 1